MQVVARSVHHTILVCCRAICLIDFAFSRLPQKKGISANKGQDDDE